MKMYVCMYMCILFECPVVIVVKCSQILGCKQNYFKMSQKKWRVKLYKHNDVKKEHTDCERERERYIMITNILFLDKKKKKNSNRVVKTNMQCINTTNKSTDERNTIIATTKDNIFKTILENIFVLYFWH